MLLGGTGEQRAGVQAGWEDKLARPRPVCRVLTVGPQDAWHYVARARLQGLGP